MISNYSQAKEAWYDYYSNGFQHISEGSFMQDFIAFFKKQDSDTHFECFNKFYQEKFPHFTIIQMIKYHKTLTEKEFNEFFESSPSKIQRDFIDFCCCSIEEHHFGPGSLWIMPEDQPVQSTIDYTDNTIINNIIDLTGDDEMPPLEAHPPPGEEVGQSDVWFPQHNQDSQLYDEDSSDEETDGDMPPLIDFDETDAEIPPLEGNSNAPTGFMTEEIPPFESDDDTTFDSMPELIYGDLMSDDEMTELYSDEILFHTPVLI